MAESVAKLIVTEGPDQGREVVLGAALVVIGRAEGCTLVLTDSNVSRRHVNVEREGDGWTVVDLGSANGTFLGRGKARISRHKLADGDEIRLGKTVVRASLPKDAAAPARGDERTQILAEEATPPDGTIHADAPSRLKAQRPLERTIVLTVLVGPDRGMVYSPAGDVITIGRMANNDVPLNDPAVSRGHATIKREAAGYVLYDESTQNGTWLGDPEVQVYHAPLEDGDVFRVGETRIRLDLGGVTSHADDNTLVAGKLGDRSFTMRVKGLSTRARAAAPASGADEGGTAAVEIDGGIVVLVKSGPSAGKRFEVARKRIVIGRSGDCDVRITEDGQISSHHCSIAIDGEKLVVRDEGSRNGTFVRGGPDKISEARIASGETIRLGSTELQIERRAAVEKTEIAPAVAVPPLPPSGTAASPPVVPAPSPAAAAEAKPAKVDVPELARSAEAKQRISRIMKGVSLRPARRPGTPRQWASLAAVLIAALVSLGLAWRYPSLLAAGPLSEGHADLDVGERCGTCHLDAGLMGTPHLEMSRGCASQDCHGDVLRVKTGVVDDCVSCHTEHRGRSFDVSGGEDLCWSCHLGAEEPRDYATRPMRAAVVTKPEEREPLLARVARVDVGLRFSHLAHDVETKGDPRFDGCAGCHPDVDSGRTFALPSHAQCMECHAESAVSADIEVAKKSPGPKCLECHAREDGSMQPEPERAFGFVEFAHRDHQDEFCKSCHAEIWDVKSYAPVVRSDLYPVPMDACYTCHEQKQATVACLDCHREHHSFPPEEAAVAGPPRAATALPNALAGLVVLSLFGFGYVYADMVLVRRWLREPPPPPAAAAGGAGGAPAAEAPKGEIMPFPTVDVEACISCSSCYNSCPKQVLAGDDHGKSVVVNKDACIALEGCAVCEQGCPTGAIRVSTAPLVRTVERPDTDEHLEAKAIPGLFFIGEVVGAALIKSAVNQGTDVVRRIADKKRKVEGADYDVIIIGAGPAGLGAGLEAKSLGLRYLLLERDTIASTIRAYPRDKAVLAEPIKVPLYGKLPMMDAEKDELIAVWEAVVRSTKLEVREHEEVTNVGRDGEKLVVETAKGKHTAANVVLAIGTRGNPRRLGCPGEDASCVSYLLIDAGEWKGKSVIVVGGGDSAIEAAVALAKAEGCTARLSYRKDKFSRVKKRNLEQIEELAKAGRIELLFESTVEKVSAGEIVIKTKSGTRTIAAVHVFALIGADPPRGWIEKIGVPFVEREEAVVAWS